MLGSVSTGLLILMVFAAMGCSNGGGSGSSGIGSGTNNKGGTVSGQDCEAASQYWDQNVMDSPNYKAECEKFKKRYPNLSCEVTLDDGSKETVTTSMINCNTN